MLILVFLPILVIVLVIICPTKPTLLGQKGLFGLWDIVPYSSRSRREQGGSSGETIMELCLLDCFTAHILTFYTAKTFFLRDGSAHSGLLYRLATKRNLPKRDPRLI